MKTPVIPKDFSPADAAICGAASALGVRIPSRYIAVYLANDFLAVHDGSQIQGLAISPDDAQADRLRILLTPSPATATPLAIVVDLQLNQCWLTSPARGVAFVRRFRSRTREE